MIFFKLIVTNLLRHRVRTLISIAGIAFSVAAMLAVVDAVAQIDLWPLVQHANPVLFGIVSSADHPIITCFGVTPTDARIRNASWLVGDCQEFGRDDSAVALGERAAEFLQAAAGSRVQIGHGSFLIPNSRS